MVTGQANPEGLFRPVERDGLQTLRNLLAQGTDLYGVVPRQGNAGQAGGKLRIVA